MTVSRVTLEFTGICAAVFWAVTSASQLPPQLPGNECESAAHGLCQFSGRFDDPGFYCKSTSRERCGRITYFGAGSTCQSIGDITHTVYKCYKGQWKVTAIPRGTAASVVDGRVQYTCRGVCPERYVEPPSFPSGCPPDQRLFSGPLEAPVTLNWTDPVTTDNSGGYVTLASSPAKLSLAGPGSHIVTVTATDGSGNKASCSFSVTVSVRECGPFDVTEGGHVNCTRKFVEGSNCTLTCDEGYDLQGQSSVTCLRSERWSAALPVCQVVTCQRPSPPVNGDFHCANGYQFSSKCSLNCQRGHTGHGPMEIQCLQNTTWSSSGVCLDVDPPEFSHECPQDVTVYASRLGQDTHVNWTPPQVEDSSGQTVLLNSTHTPGAVFMPGQTLVTYTAADPSGNKATCNFSVIVSVLSCQDPSTALSSSAMLFSCPDGHVFGSPCALRCSEGHQLVGMEKITCEQDNTTHPPTMTWKWDGGLPLKPECKESKCPALQPPKNGALSCFLGHLGWDCLMSCRQNYDVPALNDGYFYCTNRRKQWVPSAAPDCVESRSPFRVRLHGELFYLADSCDVSLGELRRRFVARINNSTFKDACVHVPSCVAENVEVTCGPVSERKKRETVANSEAEKDLLSRINRVRRATSNAGTHYVLVTFHIKMPYNDSTQTGEDKYQAFLANKEELLKAARRDARSGLLDIDFLEASEHSLKIGPVQIDCPTGTLPGGGRNKESFACVGCGAGHYLSEGSTHCEACPVGSYTELDNATSCTPCPIGWSTATTGSKHSSNCNATNNA